MIDLPTRPMIQGKAASVLRVSVAWLRQQADAGRVPFERNGQAYTFQPEDVALLACWLKRQPRLRIVRARKNRRATSAPAEFSAPAFDRRTAFGIVPDSP
jgi:hypothetical protein